MFEKKIQIPIEVSARHIHLSKKDLDVLFGYGYKLKLSRLLTQPSDFACEEKVSILFGTKQIDGVRVVGPLRGKTQIEISLSDSVGSGVVPPVRLSGQLQNSSPAVVMGPKGSVELAEGLIVAKRHIHCATSEAKKLGLKNGAMVKVQVQGERPVVFENIPVRVKDDYRLCLHLDTDEGNAAGINKIGQGIIIK